MRKVFFHIFCCLSLVYSCKDRGAVEFNRGILVGWKWEVGDKQILPFNFRAYKDWEMISIT